MMYTKEKPLRVVTLCSGYDSQCLALERLKRNYPDFDYTLVAWSEFASDISKALNERLKQAVSKPQRRTMGEA